MKKYLNEKNILYTLSFIGAICYISLIFNNNLWMDETFSSVLVHTDFSSMMEKSANDTLPPLYNILNWLMVTLFGFRPEILRLCSIIPMICVLFLSTGTVYKRFGFYTSALFTICMIGMPSMLYYGVEIRMYALSLFFVTAAGIFAIECFYNPTASNFAILSASTLGAAYTHHFAFVSCGGVYFFLLISLFIKQKSLLKKYFISLLAIGLLYIPNLFNTLKQMGRVNGYFSMPEFSLSLIVTCIKTPFITNVTIFSVALLLLFLAIPVILLIQQKSIKTLIPGILCILVFVFTMSFGAIVTVLFKANIFTPRYLFPSYGLLWLGFCILAGQLHMNRYVKAVLPAFLAIICIITYHSQFLEEYKPGVTEMTNYFNSNIDYKNDSYVIFEDDYQIEICFRYYFPEFKKIDLKNIDECNGNVWYLMVPGFEDKADTITSLGYQKDLVGDFNFDRYSFSLYKLSK